MRALRTFAPVLLLGAFALRPTPAPAACAAPTIRLAPHKVAPGDTVNVTGRYWHTGCQDHGGCSSTPCGETECEYGPEERPKKDIAIVIKDEDNDRVYEIAEVDAGPRFRLTAEIEVPTFLSPGRYRIVADDLATAPLVITK